MKPVRKPLMINGQHWVANQHPNEASASGDAHTPEQARAPVQSRIGVAPLGDNLPEMHGGFRVEYYEIGDNGDASLLISFPLVHGGRGERRISRGLLVNINRAKAVFADAGAQLPADCKGCFDGLLNAPSTIIRRITSRGGWHEDEFVTAFGSFGNAGDRPATQLETTLWAKRASGSQGSCADFVADLDQFLRVSDYLLLAFIAALTPPLASRIGRTGGFGLCFSADSSTGKTLAVRLAQSIVARAAEPDLYNFGDSDGFISDSLPLFGGLCISFADVKAQKDLKAALVKLGNLAINAVGGLTRSRKGEPERPRPQFLGILVSVERPLAQLFADFGVNFEGGEGVRLIDIPVPKLTEGGIFASAGAEYSVEWVRALNELLGDNYGCVMGPWAELLSKKRPDEIATSVKAEERRFLDRLGKQADGQLDRIAEQFALFASVGRYASRVRLLRLSSDEIDDAMVRLFWSAADRFKSRDRNVVELWQRLFHLLEDRDRLPLVVRGQVPSGPIGDGFRRVEQAVEYVYVRRESLAELSPEAGFLDHVALPRLLRLGVLMSQQAEELSVPVAQSGFGRRRCYRFSVDALANVRDEICGREERRSSA